MRWSIPIALLPCLIELFSAPHASAEARELDRIEPLVLSAELGGALMLAGGAYLLPEKGRCAWCDPPAFDETLHSPAAAGDRVALARAGHWLSRGALPLAALGVASIPPLATADPDAHAFENAAIIAEAVFVDLALNLAIKSWAGRSRPAFHYGRGEHSEYADDPAQRNVSFVSGDTGAAFTLASATATVAFLRGYAAAPYLALGGAMLASSVGVLRVKADVHWPSDVLGGALLGTGVGVAMPLLLHGRAERARRARAGFQLVPLLRAAPPQIGVHSAF